MIPKLHYISQGDATKEHLENIQKACTSGAELVQLRLKNISEKKYLKIAKEAREITAHFQTRLLICDYYKIAKEVKADGVHIEKAGLCPTVARKHLYSWQIIGASANTIQDCEALLDKQVNYISLGPYRAKVATKDGATVLGINGYTAITDVLKTGTPIIGFGGITIEDVTAIVKAGISGIAVSEAITHDFNTIRAFNQLLNASATAEQRHTFK